MSKILTDEQREAKRAYEREWRKRKYAEDPEYRKRKIATDNKCRESQLEIIRKYKLEQGCANCGYSRCARALQFHHLTDEKDFVIANTVSKKSIKAIWKEIEKCEILCANCHAEVHDTV